VLLCRRLYAVKMEWRGCHCLGRH